MLEAQSMYLGGDLISAQQASHQDSVDLGLVCPLCGQPLFLVKDFVRTIKREDEEQLIPVQPHFKHHKADPNGQLCEARSLTEEGKEFLKQLSPESKGQRLELFNRRLWDMIAWNKEFPRQIENWLQRRYPRYVLQLDEMVAHCWKHWKDPAERQQIKEAVPRSVELWTEETVAASGVNLDADRVLVQKIIEITKSDLNTRLQWAIAREVIDYLAQPHARKVFRKLVLLAMYDAIPNAAAMGRPIHSNDIQYLIMSSIGLTDWKAALEHFKKPQAGEGFGKR